MSWRREEGSDSDGRAESTLLGLILLIGMVAVVGSSMVLVADESLTSVQRQSEHERIESGFVELSQQMATASSAGDSSRALNLETDQDGTVVMTDTGQISISGGNVNKSVSIGAIEYQDDDGTTFAYQAGGVFRETGNQTRIVSAPPIEYDVESETLTFPITEVRDETRLGSGDIVVDHYETDPLGGSSLVENDTVTIEVTSKYYRGWERFFEKQGGATTVRNVEVYDNQTGTVTAEFGYQEVSDAFKTGAIYATDFEMQGGADIDDSLTQRVAYPPLTEEVDRLVNATRAPKDTFEGTEITRLGTVDEHNDSLEDGIYVTSGIEESGHLEFDLSDGNATLVVDGDINANDETITVSEHENDHELSVYLTGDYNAENGGNTCVTEKGCYENEDATVIQLVTSDESEIDFGPGGKSRFEGVIYAGGTNEDWTKRHGCDKQVCVHSNPNFFGSIIASSVEIQGGKGSIDFEYDSQLQNEDVGIYPDPSLLPPQLTYLNIAEHTVDVREK